MVLESKRNKSIPLKSLTVRFAHLAHRVPWASDEVPHVVPVHTAPIPTPGVPGARSAASPWRLAGGQRSGSGEEGHRWSPWPTPPSLTRTCLSPRPVAGDRLHPTTHWRFDGWQETRLGYRGQEQAPAVRRESRGFPALSTRDTDTTPLGDLGSSLQSLIPGPRVEEGGSSVALAFAVFRCSVVLLKLLISAKRASWIIHIRAMTNARGQPRGN